MSDTPNINLITDLDTLLFFERAVREALRELWWADKPDLILILQTTNELEAIRQQIKSVTS